MRLILHAGTHKTGTTSIQKVLGANREWLAAQGVYYPSGIAAFGNTKRPHHRFARAATLTDPEEATRALRFLANCRAAAGDGKIMLLSTEAVYKHVQGHREWDRFREADYWRRRQAYFETLAEWLTAFEVEVLLYIREPASFAESLYRELVLRKGHWQGQFAEFIYAFEPWFDYGRQIALFQSAFGTVRVENYEAARSLGLIDSFFATIGVPAPAGAEKLWERLTPERTPLFPSPTARQAFALRWSKGLKHIAIDQA